MIFLVRHAKAGSRDNELPDDTVRPLSKAGWRQAGALVRPLLAAGAAGPLVASPYVRCVETLRPLAKRIGTRVARDGRLAEGQSFIPMLELMAASPDGAVLCSHGDMIPEVVKALVRRGCTINTEPNWKKASVWVLHRDDEGVFIDAECWPPPK
ncbi:MAG TPA: phosphoglycerate mutase family protein [Ilumatobacteraceae bacterium]|jgi:8-oxo-dGTP diphosphatase